MADSQIESFGKAWVEGNWEMAYRSANLACERDPATIQHIGDRAFSLLALHRLEESLLDYQRVQELHPNTDALALQIGVLLWWLTQHSAAVESWRSGLEAAYTDPAGGVSCPAFLFFASIRLGDRALVREANAWLRRRWTPRLAKIWPGPIIGFLLNAIEQDTFLTAQTFLHPVLEARRLCKAHFWVGLSCYRSGNVSGYFAHLRQAIQDSSPEHRAIMLEPEYWLAHAELELNSQPIR
jgi:hypothetical protein